MYAAWTALLLQVALATYISTFPAVVPSHRSSVVQPLATGGDSTTVPTDSVRSSQPALVYPSFSAIGCPIILLRLCVIIVSTLNFSTQIPLCVRFILSVVSRIKMKDGQQGMDLSPEQH